MDGNEPVELPISVPEPEYATQSTPPPTVDGANGCNGALTHWTDSHTVLGYVALKHPACGARILRTCSCHACQLDSLEVGVLVNVPAFESVELGAFITDCDESGTD